MKKLVMLILLGVTTNSFASIESREFDLNGIKTLNYKNGSGNLKVSVTTTGKALAKANKIDFKENCLLKMERAGSELTIEVDSKGWFTKSDSCTVDFDLQLPKEIALLLKSGSGNIDIQGTRGQIDCKLGSGSANINAEVNQLNIMAGSGSISVDGLSGNGDVKIGSGNMTLTYRQAPNNGTLDIKAGSGNATINIPSKMTISTDFKGGSGRLLNEVGESANPSLKISMKAGSGNLEVKKLQ